VIVVDASVIVELLLRTPDAGAITARLLDSGETLHAPQLLDVEVTQVIRRYTQRGELSEEHGRAAIEILGVMPVVRYAHQPLLSRMWALRHNLTAYDAAYVALAEGLRATLVTRDRSIARVRGVAATVDVI
jgi:predicted nucleic acid-binding protein